MIVCQFNVQFPKFRDPGDMSWADALPKIVAMLRGCDVAILNECDASMAQQIAAALGMQHDTSVLNSILWRADWPVTDWAATFLPGPSYGYRRTLLTVTVAAPDGPLTVAATHLETLAAGWAKTEAEAQALRDKQATEATAHLPATRGILCGDLNDRDTTSGPRAIFRAAGYTPVRCDGIDEIFTTPDLSVTSSARIDSGGASDHDLLRAEVSMSITAADFTAVLKALGANGGQCLPAADLALGAARALAGRSPVAQAVFLATMTQESAYFRTTEEYAKTGSYAPYIGRTFEQVTWRYNYAAFGDWCASKGLIATPSLFVDKPELLAEMQWAWLGGVWFFESHGLWAYADRGDFQTVEVKVNGASPFPSGWPTRLKAYQQWTARVVHPGQLAITKTMDDPTCKRLQQWVGVAMDGDVGPKTNRAIQQWLGRPNANTLSKDDVKALQKAIGAWVDGDWGPGTTRDLQNFLNREGV